MKKTISRKRKILLTILVVLALLVVGLVIGILLSKYGLTISRYEVQTDKIAKPIRIVQLSDLHNSEFGDGNSRLIEKVKAQQPDVIFLTGDLVTQSEDGCEVAVELISALSQIAPVYASLGNHELEYQANFAVDIAKIYSDAGATVLEKRYVDIEINGQPIRLGGIYGYCMPDKYPVTSNSRQQELDFLYDFQNTDRYTILLSHNPTCWLRNTSLDDWDVACVFAGHTHGGQVRLPFAGGIYAPDLGWFPGRLAGLYHSGDGSKTLVLSRGLGSSSKVPRVNNIPEIVVVDILPAQ